MNRALLDHFLFDWLHVQALTARERYAEHSRTTFDAVLDVAERLARDKFAPYNRLADTEEPRFEDGAVHLPEATREALRAYTESGLMAAGQSAEHGGMGLPYVVEVAASAMFDEASVALSAYAMLSAANANLLMARGTPAQRLAFAQPIWDGRAMGTMCLSEPQAGSSLGDLVTRARPDGPGQEDDPLGPRYRLTGNKMWISAGEHGLSDNIIHLVLAKVPDAQGRLPAGVKGISLFVVPRQLVHPDGTPTGERNDIALAGLNHKMGYRGTVNTLLNFGEGRHPVRAAAGAIGYRIGALGEGLQHMFLMMNEARIRVGLGATMLGLAGYGASVDYARTRVQGRRLVPAPGAAEGAVPIASHPDVRRMLLAQKAYAQGGLALCLFAARLVDEARTGEGDSAQDAHRLLELLTPVVKSWPSEWCLEANNLAIQVHGGYGYTRDFPVEQYWRDNRLNMIHEGTHGIQALDLLRRKVRGDQGRALALLFDRMEATCVRAQAQPGLAAWAGAMREGMAQIRSAAAMACASDEPAPQLANATAFMQAFGHGVVAWVWLDLAVLSAQRLAQGAGQGDLHQGLLHTTRYFFTFELPKLAAWLRPFMASDSTFDDLQDPWL